MIAVIVAGGEGTRLKQITGDTPKPMVKIGGKPILHHQIECLTKQNINNVIFITNKKCSILINDYFGDGSNFNFNYRTFIEEKPLGTAGALAYIKEELFNDKDDDFLYIFGDLIFDVDFERMLRFHKNKNSSITLLVHPNSHPYDSDLIVANKDCLVTNIDSKNNVRNYFYKNNVNAGISIISKKILNDDVFEFDKKIDYEKNIVPTYIEAQCVFSYKSTEYIKDAGTMDRFYQVEKDIESGFVSKKNLSNKQKAIFIDRDGTLNELNGFINNPNDLILIDGVGDAIRKINNSEYLCILVSNQPVIARGECSFDDMEIINKALETKLGEFGAYLDGIYFCPHHPDRGFSGERIELKIKCNCRKPNIGLIEMAQKDFNLDLDGCVFVGDSTTDIQTGKNANIKTCLVLTGNKGLDKKYNVEPDYIIESLKDITNLL